MRNLPLIVILCIFFCPRYALVDFGLAQKVPAAPPSIDPPGSQAEQPSSVAAPLENEMKSPELKQEVAALCSMNVCYSYSLLLSEFVPVMLFRSYLLTGAGKNNSQFCCLFLLLFFFYLLGSQILVNLNP
jgi:hypothetical protein